jgi:Ran GTPase-activating protein (RanGAP) involved in mRNA processing and transport
LAAAMLGSSGGFSDLSYVNLSGNRLETVGAIEFLKGLKTKNNRQNIQSLNLSDCSLSAEGMRDFASALLSCVSSSLTRLDLSANPIKDSGVQELAEILPKTLLSSLSVSSCSLSSDLGIESLAAKIPGSLLSSLVLRGNKMGTKAMRALTKTLRSEFCLLERLFLCSFSPSSSSASSSSSSVVVLLPVVTTVEVSQAFLDAINNNGKLFLCDYPGFKPPQPSSLRTLSSSYASSV